MANDAGRWNSAEAAKSVNRWRESLGLRGTHHYRARAHLFTAGSPVYEMFLLTKGVAGLYYALPDHEALFMLGYPGHLINVCTPDPGAPGPISGVVLTACEAYSVRLEVLQDAARRDPVVAAVMQRSLQVQLSRRTAALAELLALTPAERLERHLRELAGVMGEQPGSGPIHMTLPFQDDELAMLLGVSPRQFKRIRNELREKGRVRLEGNRKVVLRD